MNINWNDLISKQDIWFYFWTLFIIIYTAVVFIFTKTHLQTFFLVIWLYFYGLHIVPQRVGNRIVIVKYEKMEVAVRMNLFLPYAVARCKYLNMLYYVQNIQKYDDDVGKFISLNFSTSEKDLIKYSLAKK